LRLPRTELSPSRIETKCCRTFPPVTAGRIASPLMCFHKDQIVRIGTDAMLEACVFTGQVVALRPHQAGFTFGQIVTDAVPPCALTQARSGPYAASSGLHLRSNRDRRHAPGVRLLRPNRGLHAASSGLHLRSNRDGRHAPGVHLLRPNRGLTPHQADFSFGQIGTDATLQACAYSGQIVALRRIKWTLPSVTMISDGLGSRALNAVRAHAVTYPAEGHLEDYAPLKGVA
jgi:hypothetical protein